MISDSSTHKPASTLVIPTTECVPSRPSPYPSVQRVFLIQEVAGLIMTELSPKDLLCLGLSCQALYKSAMDRLWRTTSSIAQVLLALPKELVEFVPCNQYNHPVVSLIARGSLSFLIHSYSYASRKSRNQTNGSASYATHVASGT